MPRQKVIETTEDEMIPEGAERLMSAVSKATGRKLDPEVWEDRQIMNHGCQILNRMGHLPRFEYDKNVYGPFSYELNDLFKSAGMVDADLCDIPTEDIDALSTLLSKGLDFLMAYNTLIAAFGYSPNKSHEDIKDWIVSNEPEYERFYDEAFEWLQEHRRESSSLAISIFHGSI